VVSAGLDTPIVSSYPAIIYTDDIVQMIARLVPNPKRGG